MGTLGVEDMGAIDPRRARPVLALCGHLISCGHLVWSPDVDHTIVWRDHLMLTRHTMTHTIA
jgi:hypothetical protein